MPKPKNEKNRKNMDNPKPFIPFKEVKSETGNYYVYTPILKNLTPDIINSGNMKMLDKFYEANKEKLKKNPVELAYLQARRKSAHEIERLRKKAMINLALNKEPPKPELDDKNGFVGFSNIKLPSLQTSANGCWSCAYSLLLKSRGVDLSQEKIRAWRPDYPENTKPEDKASPERQRIMNMDTGADVYENSDLINKVLPNSSMKQIKLEPFPDGAIESGGELLNEQEEQVVKTEYLKKVKRILKDVITDALTNDRSPVAISWDGHYRTVTGINPKTGKIRFEDSMAFGGKITDTMTLDELVTEGMMRHPRFKNPNDIADPSGLQLAWISDLKPPEYQKRKEEASKTRFYSPKPNLVKLDENGGVTLTGDETVNTWGLPKDGIIAGRGLSKLTMLNTDNLEKKLGKPVKSFGYPKDILMGQEDQYFPKKIIYKGDPQPLKDLRDEFKPLGEKNILTDLVADITAPTGKMSERDQKIYNQGIVKFKNALMNLHNFSLSDDRAIETERDKLPDPGQAIEDISNLSEFLNAPLGGREESGKTNLDVIFENKSPEELKAFKERLSTLDKSLGLWLEPSIHKITALETLNQIPEKFKNRWDKARDAKTPEDRVKYLSQIVALNGFYNQAKEAAEKGEEPPALDMIQKGNQIANTPAFKRLMKNGNDLILAKKRDNNLLMNRLTTENRLENYYQSMSKNHAGYAIQTADNLYSSLINTSRMFSKDSEKFNNMTAALVDYTDNPSVETLREAMDKTLEYMSGKEKPRKTPTGEQRWNACMKFLSGMMPRKDFEAYCEKINWVRGVENKPKSRNRIGIEDFMPWETVGDVLNDAQDRIRKGTATDRDYAHVIALHELNDDIDLYYEPLDFMSAPVLNENGDITALRRKTDEIMARKEFKNMMENTPREELKNMACNTGPKGNEAEEQEKEFKGADYGGLLAENYRERIRKPQIQRDPRKESLATLY